MGSYLSINPLLFELVRAELVLTLVITKDSSIVTTYIFSSFSFSSHHRIGKATNLSSGLLHSTLQKPNKPSKVEIERKVSDFAACVAT